MSVAVLAARQSLFNLETASQKKTAHPPARPPGYMYALQCNWIRGRRDGILFCCNTNQKGKKRKEASKFAIHHHNQQVCCIY